MADRILIKNAIVLTQDPSLGELPRADILVEGDTSRPSGRTCRRKAPRSSMPKATS